MSEQSSLAALASLTGKKVSAPGVEHSSTNASRNARDATRRDGFDGFLKTFLEPERSSRARDAAASSSPAVRKRTTERAAERNADHTVTEWRAADSGTRRTARKADAKETPAKAASRLPARERNGLRQALEKTVPDESAPIAVPVSPTTPEPSPLAETPTGGAASGAVEGGAAVSPESDGGARPEAGTGKLPVEQGDPKQSPSSEKAPAMSPGTGGQTVPGGENLQESTAGTGTVPEGLVIDPETAAAAEEAARIIWSIMYPDGAAETAAPGAVEAFDSLAHLAKTFLSRSQSGMGEGTGLAELGAANLDGETVTQALATANASAEMNIDAVLSALDGLLDGMPRQALDQALLKTAREMGLGSDGALSEPLKEIAAALGLEMAEAATPAPAAAPGSLLHELGLKAGLPEELRAAIAATPTDANAAVSGEGESGVVTLENTAAVATPEGETNNVAGETAKNAEATPAAAKIYGWLEQFLEGKNEKISAQRPITLETPLAPEEVDALLQEFADWVDTIDNSLEVKDLTKDKVRLAQVLQQVAAGVSGETAAVVPGGEAGACEKMKQFVKNLESFLQSLNNSGASQQSGGVVGLPGFAAGTGLSGNGILPAGLQGEGSGETLLPGGTPSVASAVAAPETGTAQPNAQPARTGQETAGSMLDRIENLERLADAMKMANRGGLKNITLALSPPELGKVMLRVEAKDGVVSAFLRVEKPEAVGQLTSGLAQLRENLKAQGIELGELDIRQHQGQGADTGGQRQKRNHETDVGDDSSRRRVQGLAGIDGDGGEEGDGSERIGGGGGGGVNLFA